MKNSLNLITLALLTLIPFYLISQRLDVQGDSRFRGHIDVAASPDSSSVYVGKGAGVNATTTNKNNSFFGREAGRNNTTGKDNSFFGRSAGWSNTTGNENAFFGSGVGALNTTGQGNSFFGYSAGLHNTTGNENSFFGREAGWSNTTGNYNSFFGYSAGLHNTTGNENSFFGREAGRNNTTGKDNSFFGRSAGWSNTTGNYNSFFGRSAGFSNTSGNDNAFFGWGSGLGNVTGDNNAFFGRSAGQNDTYGNDNAFFGRSAGFSNTSGNDNAFFGRSAGIGNMTGTRNTCIGRNANVSSNNLTNATSLGYNASANASHKVRIGSTAVTVIEGQVDWSFPSDARFKINVQDENIPGLEFISLLRPVTYQFDFRKFDQHITKNYPDSVKQEMFSNKDYSKSEHVMKTGFLAQEVEEACNRLGYHFDGLHVPESNVDNYSLAYASFVPLLIKGVQEQQEMIDAQELKINEQESEIEQLKSNQQLLEDHMAQQDDRIAHLESLVQQLLENKSEEKIENPADLHVLTHPQLMQNEPNPFNGMTRIHYFIPEDVSSQTVLIISALDGREIKRITLTQKGHGAVEIDAQLLPSGIYLYSLVIGHSLIDTKKMVHQR